MTRKQATLDTVRAKVHLLLYTLLGDPPWPLDFEGTPLRVARMLVEQFTVPDLPDVKTFPIPETTTPDLVLLRDIPFTCYCPHHLLPYMGVAHVGYLPDDRWVGLSKIPRLIHWSARGAKTQEQLTGIIADLFVETVEPKGVLVTLRARHLCVEIRGVKAHGTETITTAIRGSIDKEEVLQTLLLHGKGN